MSESGKIIKPKKEEKSDLGTYGIQSSTMEFRRNLNRLWRNEIRQRRGI